MSRISDLVKLAKKEDTDESMEIELGFIPNWQAQEINQQTQIKLNNVKKSINVYGIRHVLKGHTDRKEECPRGQKPITDSDFELIPDIISNFDRVEKGNEGARYKGILFVKKIKGVEYYVVMQLQSNKEGQKIVFKTMYAKT